MALSDIIINDVVLLQTNAAISYSNYRTLRQYLLERKPLSPVINAISALLSDHANNERQQIIAHFTQQACVSQNNSDIQEAQADELERVNDNLCGSNFLKELPVLESALTQLEMKCFIQQNNFNQVRNQLKDLKINLEDVNRQISRNYNQGYLLNTRYQFSCPFPTGNIHTHYPNGLYSQLYPIPPVVFSLQDQMIWSGLINEESRLIAERRRLTFLIDSKELDSTKEERSLNALLEEKKLKEQRYSEVKNQLEVKLPDRERQRQIRNQERFTRHSARTSQDPNLQQLSYKNHEVLKQKIATQDHKLESQRTQMMNQAIETSYQVFLSQIELALQEPNGPKLNLHERETLTSIVHKMKNYTIEAEVEQKISSSLTQERNKLKVLQEKLAESNSQLQHFITSKPKLLDENQRLKEENRQLENSRDTASTFRTTALYSSLFGACSTLISAGIVSSLLISPIFFAVPGTLALLTLVSLIVAVVYHFKKSDNEEKIELNKKTIAENETVISSQCEKANNINKTTIPALTAEIEQTKQNIGNIEQQLKEQQSSMASLMSEAHNLRISFGGSNTFFGSTQERLSSVPMPTAPFEDFTPTDDLDRMIAYGNT